jgi:ectoine hydroxylase
MSLAEDLYPSRIKNTPEVLPRVDEVVHSRWNAAAPISKAQTEAFERDGFLLIKDVFSGHEVATLQQEARRLQSAPPEIDFDTVITEPKSSAVRSVFKIHEQSAVFERIAADARLADIARFFLDDDVYIHQSRLNYKPGFRGEDFYWHSDFETWHVEDGMPRMRAVSMSVLLSENTTLNGPTMFVPGSHREFIACVGETPDEHYKQSLKKQEFGVPDEKIVDGLVAEQGIATPTGPAGSVVIFDCNTLHGSNSNITPYSRSNAFFVFNAVSNRLTAPFNGLAPRPDFVAARGGASKQYSVSDNFSNVA